MLVHFPIALLFTSVALDLSGYLLAQTSLTRAGFYLLLLGVAGAGVSALAGPDHATGSAAADALLILHQNFALLTVALGVADCPVLRSRWHRRAVGAALSRRVAGHARDVSAHRLLWW